MQYTIDTSVSGHLLDLAAAHASPLSVTLVICGALLVRAVWRAIAR